jgi:4-diphosphocytidyl-2-C-methyl-D-erythritol kinase
MLAEFAPAKINLTLRVTGRRSDGYHLLDSLVGFADVGDTIRAAASDRVSLTVSGPFGASLSSEPDNLVLRAARALQDAHGVQAGAALRLDKHLPVASGIGGGSADAAAALRVLSRLWRVDIPEGLAIKLGADVPACLACRPCRMRGIGEVLEDVPGLPACGLVLINAGVPVATKSVFAARPPAFAAEDHYPDAWADADALAAWAAASANDLEATARQICPEVGQALAALRDTQGAKLARMSGSGATCFALFATPAEARRAATNLARPGWWCWGGGLLPGLYAGRNAT